MSYVPKSRPHVDTIVNGCLKSLPLGHRVKRDALLAVVSALDLGLSPATACDLGRISQKRLSKWAADHPEVAEALGFATARSKAVASERLWQKVEEGDIVALKFWLSKRTTEFGENPEGTAVTLEREESYL